MKYRFIINKLAAQDIEESFSWYKEKSKRAADNFTIEIENAIEKICGNPKIGKNKYKDAYEIRLKKYPFIIVYLIDEKGKLIIITGVFHHMRNPETKYRI